MTIKGFITSENYYLAKKWQKKIYLNPENNFEEFHLHLSFLIWVEKFSN